jgi:DNA-binding MarR family transcriptional regulator
VTTPALRTPPLRVGILDGESLDSWLEELARRHQVAPRLVLPGLGLMRPSSTNRLLIETTPALRRGVEQATGLAPGRLDAAIGEAIPKASRLRWGGSRYCPRCLVENHGRWLLSWRLNWAIACTHHELLLLDVCPGCHTRPRRQIPGGTTPLPPASCTHRVTPRGQRCGYDLSTAVEVPAAVEALAVQYGIERLLAELDGPDEQGATAMFCDLPVVTSWLARHDHAGLDAAATRIHPGRAGVPVGQARWPEADAALTTAALLRAKTLLGGDEHAAITSLRSMLSELPTGDRMPPPGMEQAHWQSLKTRFPHRYLRAADPDLMATDRLRWKTTTPTAALPSTGTESRIRMVPQLLWPDWAGRLLPPSGHAPELLRAGLSVCLLLPGHLERGLVSHIARLNPQVQRGTITTLLQGFTNLPDGSLLEDVISVLCRIADYLDERGCPIDYQQRRERIPTEPITWSQWRDLACSVDAHPGDPIPTGRHLHARRHLHQLLSGADLTDRNHPLAFHGPADRTRYIAFTTALTTPLRQALSEHASALLTDLGINEPLTWSPPAELAHGLTLPGIATEQLDIDTIQRLVIDEQRPPGEAAQTLGVHIQHIRLALERLQRPQREWRESTPPRAWVRHNEAAQLFTREFFDREYIPRRHTIRDIAASTGFNRRIIARFAKQAGVSLTNAAAPFPIDPDWLQEQYHQRHRSTRDIAAELGIEQVTVTQALRRLGMPPRPQGTASFPQMLAVLDDDVPADIRAAVEGALHGWLRLHRFQIAMMFPSLNTAAEYLGAEPAALVSEFHRLEHDIGVALYHRATPQKPQHPTPRGQALLADLEHERIQRLMTTALPEHQQRPAPEAATLAEVRHKASRPASKPGTRTRSQPRARKPEPVNPVDELAVTRLRLTRPVLTVLGDLIEHPGEFYGLEIRQRTGVDEGTLYPMLKRLQQRGWLTSRPEDEQAWLAGAPPGRGPGRRRTYYAFTTDGHRAALHELDRRSKRKTDETQPMQNQ